MIKKSSSNLEVINEIRKSKCRNIAKPISIFEIDNYDCTINKKANCDLYEFLENHDKIDFVTSLQIIKGALNALRSLHRNHILHGDIKLENFLVYYDSKPQQHRKSDFGVYKKNNNTKLKDIFSNRSIDVVLNDFDTACILNDNELCYSNVGTNGYAAPEFLNGHSFPADIYALGITLSYVWAATQKGDYNVSVIDDLLVRMISKNPKDRPTSNECYKCFMFYVSKLINSS